MKTLKKKLILELISSKLSKEDAGKTVYTFVYDLLEIIVYVDWEYKTCHTDTDKGTHTYEECIDCTVYDMVIIEYNNGHDSVEYSLSDEKELLEELSALLMLEL